MNANATHGLLPAFLILVLACSSARAAKPDGNPDSAASAHGDAAKSAELAKKATDPSAVLTQLGFFFWTQELVDGTDGLDETARTGINTVLVQPVLPLTKKNVLRPALAVISISEPSGETGFGDLFLLDVQIEQVATGSLGWGGVASLPTATDDRFGTGKWQAGPMFMYMNKVLPNDMLGLLAYHQWSFAGDSDRSSQNHSTFQPIWVHQTDWGYIGWTDLTADYNWQTEVFSVPVGFRFGKVYSTKTPLNFYIEPYYRFNSKDVEDVYGFKIGATFIMPTWLTH